MKKFCISFYGNNMKIYVVCEDIAIDSKNGKIALSYNFEVLTKIEFPYNIISIWQVKN